MSSFCVVGIDTSIGKTQAVGQIARTALKLGVEVITCKLVQTGCVGISEDIETHRKIMGIPMKEIDLDGTTCPYVFPFPASPHLAAEMACSQVEVQVLDRCLSDLQSRYDLVVIEGSGGLMVPLTRDLLLIDFLADRGIPVVLVTSPRLGSLNHTLLSLEALAHRNIPVQALVYNLFDRATPEIQEDTKELLTSRFPQLRFWEMTASQ